MEGRGKVDEKKEKERKKGKEEKGRARKWRKEARWQIDFWNGTQTKYNPGDLWME